MWTGTIGAHSSPSTAATGGQLRLARWIFTDRRGGVSPAPFDSLNVGDHVGDDPDAVACNRQVVLDAIGSSTDRLVFMQAQHGSTVRRVVNEAQSNNIEVVAHCDGLVTTDVATAIAALAADFVPIVLADIQHGVVGVVHCGWRGVVSGVAIAALSQMRELGAAHSAITAVVGPAICGACYPVDSGRASSVAAALPREARGKAVWSDAADQWHVDVRKAAISQLLSANIAVEVVGGCTFTADTLFSYRRDGLTGRQSAAIVLEVA